MFKVKNVLYIEYIIKLKKRNTVKLKIPFKKNIING